MTPEEFAKALEAKLKGVNISFADLLKIAPVLQERLKDGFGPDDLWWAAEQVVLWAAEVLPGATGQEKAGLGRAIFLAAIEMYDQQIPFIGQFMDLSWVDDLEAWAFGWLYDQTLGALVDSVIKGAYAKTVLAGKLESNSYNALYLEHHERKD